MQQLNVVRRLARKVLVRSSLTAVMCGWPGAAWKTHIMLLVVAALLIACAPVRAEARPVVNLTEHQHYAPASLRVAPGTTVIWRNTSHSVHTVSSDQQLAGAHEGLVLPGGAQPLESGALYPGETWSYIFVTPGHYLYVCRFHAEQGMVGSVVVSE